MKMKQLAASIMMGGGILVAQASASTYTWNVFPSGDYTNSSSWAPIGVPTSIDRVSFNANGFTNTVNFTQNEVASEVQVYNGNTAIFNLNGFTWTTVGGQTFLGSGAFSSSTRVTGGGVWDVSSQFVNIGDGDGRGDLTIDSGTAVRVLFPTIAYQATAPNASTLWVKNGGAYEVDNASAGLVGNANNHATTITGAGTLRPTATNPSGYWQANNYGIIAPGDAGPGTLTMQDAAIYMKSGAGLAMEINGTGGGQYDQLFLQKVTTLGYISFDPGTFLSLNILPGYNDGQVGDTFNLVIADTGGIVGLPSLQYDIGSITNYEARLEIVTFDATHDALRLTIVPEPTSTILCLSGVLLFWFRRRS